VSSWVPFSGPDSHLVTDARFLKQSGSFSSLQSKELDIIVSVLIQKSFNSENKKA